MTQKTSPDRATGNDSRETQQAKFVMKPTHPLWEKFCERLGGPEGCDFQPHPTKCMTFKCEGLDAATRILRNMGADVDASLEYFAENGGYCDCEILLNVDRDEVKAEPGKMA
jgi:hypothetical protein